MLNNLVPEETQGFIRKLQKYTIKAIRLG